MNLDGLTPEAIEPYVRLALDAARRPYPYHMVHVVNSDADVRPPRELNPAFYGCFDWHSAVHGHWTLARGIHLFPDAPWADEAQAALRDNLTEANLKREAEYFNAPGREGFERPYGLAWVLQLVAELREIKSVHAINWARWLRPLEKIADGRLGLCLLQLSHPVRSGEHGQTAFAMGLALDYARVDRDRPFAQSLVKRAREFFLADATAPLAYEPSGHDFLSPTLAEADLMRRVLPREEFATWLHSFLPQIPQDRSTEWLPPAWSHLDDGKLAHLDGLCLSRAWMLEGIAHGLPEGDARRTALLATAQAHAFVGLERAREGTYSRAHWLGTFAVYYLTRRGIT